MAKRDYTELNDIQNELSAYCNVDIVTITGFMNAQEFDKHIEASKRKLERLKRKG